jgi:hypothetical protein
MNERIQPFHLREGGIYRMGLKKTMGEETWVKDKKGKWNNKHQFGSVYLYQSQERKINQHLIQTASTIYI